MFKRLRERIAEEATKFPVGQLANNPGKPLSEPENKSSDTNSTEDLITLSDSSSVVVPHTSSQQFSIGEEEDGSLSEHSTPQKKQDISSAGANVQHSAKDHHLVDLGLGPEYRPKKFSYIPQSDIESEREDPPTLNLDGISKDQLMAIIQSLKAKAYKYRNKYSEVVKNFKELRDEKIKIENALIENQDKGLRRIAELREQCQLEQNAKAHLEEMLRLLLEEKDSRISVLETQINLLKEGRSGSTKTLPEDCENQFSDSGSNDSRLEDGTASINSDVSALQEKIERLQHQHNQDKKAITAQKEQIALLRKQNENLSKELEDKIKSLIKLENKQAELMSDHESVLKKMQDRLKELEKQQEESVMSMAETKRNMHEELELKEKQLIKAEEEAKQYQVEAEREKGLLAELKKKHEEEVKDLFRKLELTEKTLEDEKQSLLHELGQGKTAAINLMQQECAKKILAIEEEWKSKYDALQSSYEKSSQTQIEELSNSLQVTKEKLKEADKCIEDLQSAAIRLEKENSSLKNSVEKLENEQLEAHHEESLKCMKDKLQNAEKNYNTQMEEMKLKINELVKENGVLLKEKERLLSIQGQFEKLKGEEDKMQSNLTSTEEQLKVLQEKLETSNKEQIEKIHSFQENMKDKENMILKLKGNMESISKGHSEKVEELSKKIKRLEVEREQLMLQAQERVSATEAKCREDIKSLQEKCDRLQIENNELEKLKKQISIRNAQLDESLIVAESNQASANKEILKLKDELADAKNRLAEVERIKSVSESELSIKLEKLQQENKQLLCNSDHVEKLKAEKEELNEKLKTAVQQVNKINVLETERDNLKKENEELSKEVNIIRTVQSESTSIREKLKVLEENESAMRIHIEELTSTNEKLKAEILSLQESFKNEKYSLESENDKLLNRIQQLEMCVSDPQSTSLNDYIKGLKQEYEMALKAKDDDMLSKLKQLVRDFSFQMDVKDKDSEQIITDLLEKNQYLEEKLQREHAIEITALRQELLEKDRALEEVRDSYEESLQEKDAKIKEQNLLIKSLAPKDNLMPPTESFHNASEHSDWDDSWVVPDEVVENSSPVQIPKTCDDHLEQISSLQEELSKCNSEIKELKVLLRLSPPDTMVNNNNRRDSLHSVPEPTEFEYLKNIIYEYMMGKEPVTLAKVIAAVLRFNDVQTQQVIRREEARHPTK